MNALEQTTLLLKAISAGDASAADQLYPLVYQHLRDVAAGLFRQQPRDHTLQPTALVNEAFLKLAQKETTDWQSRAHFLAVAAKAMRQILIDHARSKGRQKRGGEALRLTLDEGISPADAGEPDVLDLEDALQELGRLDPRQSQVVELRFFGGLTVDEVAHVLDLSKTTVEQEWRIARAWLRRSLVG